MNTIENGEIARTRECIRVAFEIVERRECLNLDIFRVVLRELDLFRGRRHQM